jgi:hypothetical protein
MITLDVSLPDEYLIYEGKTFQVEFYVKENKEIPGFEYYRSMKDSDKARFMVVATHVANAAIGEIHPKTVYNIEDKENKIYAFKPNQHRFFNFTTADQKMIITNAYKKQSDKMTKKDKEVLKTAIRFRADYEERISRGTYYA